MKTLTSFFVLLCILLESIPFGIKPVTLVVDATNEIGEIGSYASGYLYGLAEEGVPSEAVVESLDVSSVSQKVIGGLQHPVGDVDNVHKSLDNCDYIVVYMQDVFDTWYYCHDEIMQLRSKGEYDWKAFIEERFFPQLTEKVEALLQTEYADRLVYCLYNECDNAVWFGDWVEDENSTYGGWCDYNEKGRQNFNEAWKMAYDLVKSIDPNAIIGGPGFCLYETNIMENFLSFCVSNSCLPEIMIYHELAYWSVPDWNYHIEDYRRLENKYGIDPIQIIVTEYGCMDECGDPSKMLPFINAMEETDVYGNVAFWRLANNLCDTVADYNTPNSNWWLYRRYADMEGQQLKTEVDCLKYEKTYEHNDYRYGYKGMASITDSKDRIDIIATGSAETRRVKITNADKTNLGSKVNVKVETVYFTGISGAVYEPVLLREYNCPVVFGNVYINLGQTDGNSVYLITVTPENKDCEPYLNKNVPVRYEFESGKLLGSAYTYDSAYATTGEVNGMVGGIEKDDCGVSLDFKIPKSGNYTLDIIFGNANDGNKPSDRDYTEAIMIIDGEAQTINLENTIKSEYTDRYSITQNLKSGKHNITFMYKNGTYVLDSMIVSPTSDKKEIAVLNDADRTKGNVKSYLAIAPYDGFYKVNMSLRSCNASVDGAKTVLENNGLVYLRRGLNYIDLETTEISKFVLEKTDEKGFAETITARDMTVSETAFVSNDKYGVSYIDGITANSGGAEFTVNAPKTGDYRLTLTYSNNAEGGVHSYNVDLIERYVTVSTENESKNVYCRNTYSDYTYKTVTFELKLNEGENIITLSNNGEKAFNNQTPAAPRISVVTVNSAS